MSEPTTAAGRKMLGVFDSLMAVLHGIATADLPENIAAHAKTTDQVKEELAALVLAIEAEAAALVATPAPLDDSVRGEWGRQTCCPFPHDEDSGPDIHPRHQRTYQPATFAAATPAPLDEPDAKMLRKMLPGIDSLLVIDAADAGRVIAGRPDVWVVIAAYLRAAIAAAYAEEAES